MRLRPQPFEANALSVIAIGLRGEGIEEVVFFVKVQITGSLELALRKRLSGNQAQTMIRGFQAECTNRAIVDLIRMPRVSAPRNCRFQLLPLRWGRGWWASA